LPGGRPLAPAGQGSAASLRANLVDTGFSMSFHVQVQPAAPCRRSLPVAAAGRFPPLLVPVIVTDETGEQPIECEMVWAWVPKKK